MKFIKFLGFIVAVLILLVVLAFLFLMLTPQMSISNDIDEWKVLQETQTYLPTVEQFGNYSDLEFKYQHLESFLMKSDSYILKLRYSKDDFTTQKDYINNTYKFQDKVINRGVKSEELNASFDFDGYSFRLLSLEEYDLDFPKAFAMIGICEETRTICYVFYMDQDLDYMGSSFDEFLVKECGW